VSVIPPEEFRRRAQESIAERSGAVAPVVPADLQLPPAQGGTMSIGASAPPAAITSDHSGGLLDFIRTAILSLQHFAEQTNDDAELAAVHKCITALQNILAGHSKNRDAALGMSPALKHVRRVNESY
jgi:hypothetical protein